MSDTPDLAQRLEDEREATLLAVWQSMHGDDWALALAGELLRREGVEIALRAALAEAQALNERHGNQARDISTWLAAAGVGPCPIPEGVRLLLTRAEAAEARADALQAEVTRLKENAPDDFLVFVKREGPGYPGNKDSHPGTTIQEVLRALIDRIKYLDQQVPNFHNYILTAHLREGIHQLELRAAERHGRKLELTLDERAMIESLSICQKCGHIGCEGNCH